jgi:flagellin FlaB
MIDKFAKAMARIHKGQKGMTGLETAIILIAFVTVASVLAYSVLSAGIFSAERGKATVYQGLSQAQATMEVKGSVLGLSANGSELETVQLTVGLTIPDEVVDMDAVVVNYFDDANHDENVTWSYAISDQSTERGSASLLEADEQHVCTITIPEACTVDAYDWFVLQVIPPTGATLTIKRTMPGAVDTVMDLQ